MKRSKLLREDFDQNLDTEEKDLLESFERGEWKSVNNLEKEDEHFEIKSPNSHTRKSISELESGKGNRFRNIKALMEDLNEDD